MKQLLWFCRTSDSSSLARITDSVVPLLKPNYDITLLSNETKIKGVKHVTMGADTECVKYLDFLKTMPGALKNGNIDQQNIRCINMKYILVQLVDLIYDGNYEYLLICNGVYEIDWITKIITSDERYLMNSNGKKTKLVVWAPIDYIPSMRVIQNVIKADLFLTMTPVMATEIETIIGQTYYDRIKCKIDWVGHGSDVDTIDRSGMSREQLIAELNRLGTKISTKTPIKSTDIIILNANNYGPLDPKLDSVKNTPGTRKRLDITVKAFLKVLEKNKNVKLWIHTNLKSFFEMLAIENLSIITFIDNVIFSNNTVTNEELSIIYQLSDISIQTSTGEGWSLTNLEASMYKSLQVVPDFLACGYHFKDRGILIPVTRKTIKNEGGIDVIIGEVSVEDTAFKLQEAIELCTDNFKMNTLDRMLTDAYNYAKNYTWSSVADKLTSLLE
jgi:glycosyltransferase involved in cell wall biosynthesis